MSGRNWSALINSAPVSLDTRQHDIEMSTETCFKADHQHLLHCLDFGPYKIRCLIAVYIDSKGQSFQYLITRHRFQFLAKPCKWLAKIMI